MNEAGISFDTEREYSDLVEEGKVISQSVADGEALEENERVWIVISKGLEKVSVPDVSDKKAEDAKVLLEAAGFTVKEEEEYSEDIEEGMVISQDPEGNTEAAKGSTVTIVVSKGEEVKVSKVPNLKKKTVSEAEAALSEVNLKLGNVKQEYHDSIPEGQVISQSIAEGTEVKENTAVDITISKGKEQKTVTYSATFAGAITNSIYSFEEGEAVYVSVTLKVGDASYDIIKDYYQANSFPIDLSGVSAIDGLTSKNATLVYSVKNENGEDITGSFSSTAQAKLKAVEQ